MDELKNQLHEQQKLQEIARGFRKSQILLTCLELGIFDELAKCDSTSQVIAKKIRTDPRATELLLNAAVSLGFVEKEFDVFKNSLLANSFLTTASPDSISQNLRLNSAFYQRWTHLLEAVRSGKRPEENRLDERPENWIRNFTYSLYNSSRFIAPIIASKISLPMDQPIKILDVGGGHGGYSIALAHCYPLLTATIFELPGVVPVAREIIENAGMSKRIIVQEGDFQKDDLGSHYDAALVFGVLNGESPEGRPKLISKVYNALKPGGQIVIRDSVLDHDRVHPTDAAIFALQMLLSTESGGLDTFVDWEKWLVAAGFNQPEIVALPKGTNSFLTTAKKPL